jgi:hypothetical protein
MYSNQITGAQWMLNVSNSASNIVNDINQALVWTTKWNAMTYGLTDPQILALPQITAAGWTEADLTAFKYCVGVFSDLSNALNNLPVATANRIGYLEPFV